MSLLELIIGPMFSGKTTLLIKRYNDIKLNNTDDKILVINHIIDSKRYTNINEGQFFEDLQEWVINILDTTNINIIICGLDSDYKRCKFGQIWELVPHANYINKLHGTCNNCTNASIFTHRVTDDKGQVVVGTCNYIPLCRKCYAKLNP